MTRRERRLRGYRNKKFNFSFNTIYFMKSELVKLNAYYFHNSEITITNMTGHDIIINHLGSEINLRKDEKIKL